MAWMSDEAYELMQDTKEKAHTARSASSTRTHNGKSGCNFAHEKMSKKELQSMNGKVETYRMNSPMTWDEFKSMPDDLKAMYIKALRKKYNVPDKYIAEMMGVDRAALCKLVGELGLGTGKKSGGQRIWDKEGFLAWCNGVKKAAVTSETPVEDKTDNEETPIVRMTLEEDIGKEAADEVEALLCQITDIITGNEDECCGETKCIIPSYGEMTFEGNIDDILRTISKTLNGSTVHLMVKWDVLDNGGETRG